MLCDSREDIGRGEDLETALYLGVRLGACEYVLKSFEMTELFDLVANADRHLQEEHEPQNALKIRQASRE